MNLLTKQKETRRKQTYSCQGEEIVREFGMDMFTLLYLRWMTNKDLLYSTGDSAQCYMAAWIGEEFGGERIHVYVLSAFAIYLNLSQRCLLTIPQYKI